MPSCRSVAVALGLGLAASVLVSTPAAANPAGSGLVINEVYGAGGNSGALYNADFVEILNPTGASIDLLGKYVSYRSSSGSAGGSPIALKGSLPAGEQFVVRMSATAGSASAVPADLVASPTVSMAAGGGQVFLTDNAQAITATGQMAGRDHVIDMVGLDGSTSYEGTGAGPTATATSSAQRTGGTDTDNNTADFSLAAPTPTGCGCFTAANVGSKSIAEIQGTTDTSPFVYDTATTRGVITAAYPTGGFNGFFMQTEGTGGATDATAGSDGVFVFGSQAMASTPTVGDFVEVTGSVSEFAGSTQLTPAAGGVVKINDEAHTAPVALPALPTTEASREAHESELFDPDTAFTVTNTFNTNNFAEIGLATGDEPLIAPTEVARPGTPEADAVAADNAVRAITLDDGSSSNFIGSANGTPTPWITPTDSVRVGAGATLHTPVVLDWRNNVWKIQPLSQVTGQGTEVATFENTRGDNAEPQSVGGDLKLATFNVLNYFPTTGEEFDALPNTTCSYFNDRDGVHIGVNSCTPDGPRGAATTVSFQRQQAKTVTAINKLGADIVSLEELENSAKFGKNRDFAIANLVDALNAAAGAGTWAFVPSPAPEDRPTVAQEDVIRTGFIYKPASVATVGSSRILVDETHFGNAREPLAQAFKPAGAGDDRAFSVIVNHFKSKGSGVDDGTGQGNANPDRVGQANALVSFADQFAADRATDAVFLAGDFNSYSKEDPMQVLYDDGYEPIESDTEGEETYSFSGLVGSLDHVLGNAAAMELVTGADVWNINSPEPVAYQYSRFNYNVTQFFDATNPFGASDHDPEIVGLNTVPAPVDVQILGTNDFHGRLANNPTGTEAGAAVLAGAVKQLRGDNPNTVFAAAGDLIGASTFDSFIQDDKPTIDALNEAGLEVSAVGNHEFDKGYDDLVNRVMADYNADTNPRGGAEWKYLGANVKFKDDGSDALDGTWIKDMNGVQVGFVGTVTEHLPELVSPGGISEIEVTDIVGATNQAANDLKAEGADVVVMLVHEGAPGTDCAKMDDDPTSDFGSIITGVNNNVDAIVSGHTHLAYNCSFPVEGWTGRPVTDRPVVSAGQYGSNLNRLVFTVDRATGEVQAKSQQLLALKTGQTANYPSDAATTAIVQAAVDKANELGKQELGQIAGPFNRGKLANGTTENRGAESTLGNRVAEVQRWATETPEAGGAEIAFMNPGGLRADMVGDGTGSFPRTLTYRQAADVQSFANTLVNMQLTGADIESALEQQWQPAGASRPFLRLGASEGFTYTYEPPAAGSPTGTKGEVTQMWLNGEPIDPAQTYSVTVNSFLSTGGDNFPAFNNGTEKRDTGKVDLEAMVDYMAEFANPEQGDVPLRVDYTQRAVGIKFPATAPAAYQPGDTVAFDVSSWSFTTAPDAKDTDVAVSLNGNEVGSFPLDNAAPAALPGFDDQGRAAVSFTLPAGTPAGEQVLTLTGETTGTTTEVPVTVEAAPAATSTTSATATPDTVKVKKGTSTLDITVESVGTATPTGTVEAWRNGVLLGSAELDAAGHAPIEVGPFTNVGTKTIEVRYLGDEATTSSETTVDIEVVKRNPTIVVDREPRRVIADETRTVLMVDVRAGDIIPTGRVQVRRGGEVLQTGRLDEAGTVRLRLPVFNRAGEKTVRVVYAGDDDVLTGSEDYTITVINR
jgi:5'-nucleotidase